MLNVILFRGSADIVHCDAVWVWLRHIVKATKVLPRRYGSFVVTPRWPLPSPHFKEYCIL